jgi:hypothetical protein
LAGRGLGCAFFLNLIFINIMDLLKLAETVTDTVKIHIELPGDGPLYADEEKTKPCIVEVYGPASKEFQAWKTQSTQKVFDKAAQRGGFKLNAKTEQNSYYEKLIALTVNVENLEFGAELVTLANVGKMYRHPKLGFIAEQVDAKLASWDSFLA